MKTKKKVDKVWKAKVKKEKGKEKKADARGKAKGTPEEKQAVPEKPLPELNFSTFISGLGMQSLLLLGEVSAPQAKDKVKSDYQQVRYTIELIDMLKKKTEGNLTPEETNLIENILYDLRMRYLNALK